MDLGGKRNEHVLACRLLFELLNFGADCRLLRMPEVEVEAEVALRQDKIRLPRVAVVVRWDQVRRGLDSKRFIEAESQLELCQPVLTNTLGDEMINLEITERDNLFTKEAPLLVGKPKGCAKDDVISDN